MIARLFIFISFLLLSTTTFAQENTTSLGFRMGYVKNSFYDESINFKIYNGFDLNPFHIRFVGNTGKNTYIADLMYVSNTLKPATRDNFVISDEIAFRSAALDFTYLRQFFTVTEKLNCRFGAKLSTDGFESNRVFRKTFNSLSGKQSTYDFTFFSLSASGRVEYAVSESAWFSGIFDFPFLALNLKNYNAQIDPKHQDLWLTSIDKYAGFAGDIAFVKQVNRFSFEIFHGFQFKKYKEPYAKKILTNKTGIGICYEL
jgi:hypothetical protein